MALDSATTDQIIAFVKQLFPDLTAIENYNAKGSFLFGLRDGQIVLLPISTAAATTQAAPVPLPVPAPAPAPIVVPLLKVTGNLVVASGQNSTKLTASAPCDWSMSVPNGAMVWGNTTNVSEVTVINVAKGGCTVQAKLGASTVQVVINK